MVMIVSFHLIPLTILQCHVFLGHLNSPDYSLIDLVIKASASRAEDTEFDSCLHRAIILSPTTDFGIDTPVATLPGAWHYRVSAWTGWPGVSVL